MIKYVIYFLLVIGYILSNIGIKPTSNFLNDFELLPIGTGNWWIYVYL